MIRAFPNDENKAMQATLIGSLVLSDIHHKGTEFIQRQLEETFPIPHFKWVARAIHNDRFLLDPLDAKWRETAIRLEEVRLGGFTFPIEAYSRAKFEGGHHPIPIWIKVYDLRYRFFKPVEYLRIVDSLSGGILLDVDRKVIDHIDFRVLRMKVGVCDKEVIPPLRKLKFVEDDGEVKFFVLRFEMESDQPSHIPSNP